jgi:type IV fimbrial biogenesis protein FimT
MINFLRSNQLTANTNDVVADLQLARSEAVKRGANAVLCKSTDGATCTGGGTWADGWVVFADMDNSGTWTQTASQEDVFVKRRDSLPGGTTVNASDVIAFTRQGMLSGGGTRTYTICDTGLRRSRTITLSPAGRTNLSEGTC